MICSGHGSLSPHSHHNNQPRKGEIILPLHWAWFWLTYNPVHVVKEVLIGHNIVCIVDIEEIKNEVCDVLNRLTKSIRQHAGRTNQEEEEAGKAEDSTLIFGTLVELLVHS